ncbi:hypothetical protein E2C01_015001 [Portunus trituberculatus]|uniref:Uncharacterized protein n=1 Tax=Portunus trituberculatus TaxID=210409 RepID=A0A5B7DLD8_PORTR|nr:hypothetical protein [Portunus trituberculatus]
MKESQGKNVSDQTTSLLFHSPLSSLLLFSPPPLLPSFIPISPLSLFPPSGPLPKPSQSQSSVNRVARFAIAEGFIFPLISHHLLIFLHTTTLVYNTQKLHQCCIRYCRVNKVIWTSLERLDILGVCGNGTRGNQGSLFSLAGHAVAGEQSSDEASLHPQHIPTSNTMTSSSSSAEQAQHRPGAPGKAMFINSSHARQDIHS